MIYVAGTSNQNIFINESQAFELALLSIQKKGSYTGGDIFDCFSCQYAWIHDISTAPFTNGATWVDGLHFAIDPVASPTSTLYDDVERVRILPFSVSVGGITGCAVNLIGGNASGSTKVVNSNRFNQLTTGPHAPSGGTGFCTSLATGSVPLVNENTTVAMDGSGNAQSILLGTNSTRDQTFIGGTAENNTNQGIIINSGNLYANFIGMEVTNNSSGGSTCASQVTDNGTATSWRGNIPKCGVPPAFTLSGGIAVTSTNGIGLDGSTPVTGGTAGNIGAVKMASGDGIQAGGSNSMVLCHGTGGGCASSQYGVLFYDPPTWPVTAVGSRQ